MNSINTCFETTQYLHSIAYYSHLIPIAIIIVLAFFVLIKSKGSFLAKIFTAFALTSGLWLAGDVLLWTSDDYYLINAIWSTLDYINILFYLLAAYFLVVLVRGEDISVKQKIIFFTLSLPAWWITVTGHSITGFNQPQCEAFNNSWLTEYKLIIEGVVLLFIIIYSIYNWRKSKSDRPKQKQIVLVSSALILFLSTFSITEYISSQTGIYEINLYSLFILPIFLFMIIYSITNLKIFMFKSFGTQLLTYVLLIMIGSQFFFLQDSTDKILTIVTFILSLIFTIILLRNISKEEKARLEIERLASDLQKTNTRLEELNIQKTEFVSFATHQLRSPLTAMKGYASLILEGDMGAVTPETKQAVERIFDSSKTLTNVVDNYLNISRIELGTMKYFISTLDMKKLVEELIGEIKPNITTAGLEINFTADAKETYMIEADADKFKQVIANLIDNSIKYTPKGKIDVTIDKNLKTHKILFSLKDTGIGMSDKTLPKLFKKFSRSDKASETNIRGTGLGLYLAKEIVAAHKGKIWATSDGENKGSHFFVEMDAK